MLFVECRVCGEGEKKKAQGRVVGRAKDQGLGMEPLDVVVLP